MSVSGVSSFSTSNSSGWQKRDPFTITISKSQGQPLGIAFSCLPHGQGICVRALRPGSAADRSGLLAIGDVITAINSIPLTMSRRSEVEQVFSSAGNVLELTVTGFVAPEAMDAFLEAQDMDTLEQSHMSPLGWVAAFCKAILVLPVLASIFSLSILEGLSRVLFWHLRKTLNSALSDKHADPDNFLFDIMMAIWYGFVVPSDDYGFARTMHPHSTEDHISALTSDDDADLPAPAATTTASAAAAADIITNNTVNKHTTPAVSHASSNTTATTTAS